MSSPLRNGHASIPTSIPSRSPPPAIIPSSVSDRKLRRLNLLILLLRFAAFCFSLAAAVFMFSNTARSDGSVSWDDFQIFRLVAAANSIVAVYSLFAIGTALWEILRGTTLLPEGFQLWFDFSHDQVFAYLLLTAEAAGTGEARGLGRGDTCTVQSAFCIQADISVALGFVAFAFLALSALISGFRVVCHLIIGYRFNI